MKKGFFLLPVNNSIVPSRAPPVYAPDEVAEYLFPTKEEKGQKKRKKLAILLNICYYSAVMQRKPSRNRGIAQLIEQRSPKP